MRYTLFPKVPAAGPVDRVYNFLATPTGARTIVNSASSNAHETILPVDPNVFISSEEWNKAQANGLQQSESDMPMMFFQNACITAGESSGISAEERILDYRRSKASTSTKQISTTTHLSAPTSSTKVSTLTEKESVDAMIAEVKNNYPNTATNEPKMKASTAATNLLANNDLGGFYSADGRYNFVSPSPPISTVHPVVVLSDSENPKVGKTRHALQKMKSKASLKINKSAKKVKDHVSSLAKRLFKRSSRVSSPTISPDMAVDVNASSSNGTAPSTEQTIGSDSDEPVVLGYHVTPATSVDSSNGSKRVGGTGRGDSMSGSSVVSIVGGEGIEGTSANNPLTSSSQYVDYSLLGQQMTADDTTEKPEPVGGSLKEELFKNKIAGSSTNKSELSLYLRRPSTKITSIVGVPHTSACYKPSAIPSTGGVETNSTTTHETGDDHHYPSIAKSTPRGYLDLGYKFPASDAVTSSKQLHGLHDTHNYSRSEPSVFLCSPSTSSIDGGSDINSLPGSYQPSNASGSAGDISMEYTQDGCKASLGRTIKDKARTKLSKGINKVLDHFWIAPPNSLAAFYPPRGKPSTKWTTLNAEVHRNESGEDHSTRSNEPASGPPNNARQPEILQAAGANANAVAKYHGRNTHRQVTPYMWQSDGDASGAAVSELPQGYTPMLPPNHPHAMGSSRPRRSAAGQLVKPVAYRWAHDHLDEDMDPTLNVAVPGRGLLGGPTTGKEITTARLHAPVVAPRPDNETYEEMRERHRVAAKRHVKERRELGVRGMELNQNVRIHKWMQKVEDACGVPEVRYKQRLLEGVKGLLGRKEWVYEES